MPITNTHEQPSMKLIATFITAAQARLFREPNIPSAVYRESLEMLLT
jgi:hypothetical protein